MKDAWLVLSPSIWLARLHCPALWDTILCLATSSTLLEAHRQVTHLIVIGKAFGVRQIEKEIDVLDRACKVDACKKVELSRAQTCPPSYA